MKVFATQFFISGSLALCLLVSACAPFAPSPKDQEAMLPASFPQSYPSTPQGTATSSITAKAVEPWWKAFASQDLDHLMDKALAANFDILTAWANLRQSEALSGRSRSGFFPSLDASAGAEHERRSTQANEDASRFETTSDTINLGLAASYELDLWGRVNSGYQADLLRTSASEYDVQSAAVTVTATLADAWASLLGNRAELAVVNQQIETNTLLLELLTIRFANGLSSGLDVLQQQELLASVEAELPPLEQGAATLRNQLAVLQGTLPGSGLAIDENAPLPILPSIPNPGLPVQILDARPDVRAAWARFNAAEWDVSEAHANRYPALRLSASGIFGSASSAVLFNNWITSLAGSLVLPLFDGGNLASEEAVQRAEAEALVQTYAKAVATALQDVDDSLATETGEFELLQRLNQQMTFAAAALNEARNSYLGGVNTFLNYITQLKSVQALERSIARQHTEVLRARIALYRSLGGMTLPELTIKP